MFQCLREIQPERNRFADQPGKSCHQFRFRADAHNRGAKKNLLFRCGAIPFLSLGCIPYFPMTKRFVRNS